VGVLKGGIPLFVHCLLQVWVESHYENLSLELVTHLITGFFPQMSIDNTQLLFLLYGYVFTYKTFLGEGEKGGSICWIFLYLSDKI